MVVLALAVARQQRGELVGFQIARAHRKIDQVARKRHPHGDARLAVADESVEGGRGEDLAERAELGQAAEEQVAHRIVVGVRDDRVPQAEVALDKRRRPRFEASIAQGPRLFGALGLACEGNPARSGRGTCTADRCGHGGNTRSIDEVGLLAGQDVAEVAVGRHRLHANARADLVEVEGDFAGHRAEALHLRRHVYVQRLLHLGQHGGAEERHVLLRDEQAHIGAFVDHAQKVGAASKLRRAAVHDVAHPQVHTAALRGKHNIGAALDAVTILVGFLERHPDLGICVNDVRLSDRARADIGAANGERPSVERVEQLDDLRFREADIATDIGRQGDAPAGGLRAPLAQGDGTVEELRHATAALGKERRCVRESELLPVREALACAHARHEVGDALHDVGRRGACHLEARRPQTVAVRERALEVDRAFHVAVVGELLAATHELGDAGRCRHMALRRVTHELLGRAGEGERERGAVLAQPVVFHHRGAGARPVLDRFLVRRQIDRGAIMVIPPT